MILEMMRFIPNAGCIQKQIHNQILVFPKIHKISKRTIISHSFESNITISKNVNKTKEDTHIYFERPGTLFLMESNLHPSFHDKDNNAWNIQDLGMEFSKRGIGFSSMNPFEYENQESQGVRNNRNGRDYFQQYVMELTKDIQSIQDPGTILIANGPIPSLVAQYYLESYAITALVMINPFIQPFHLKWMHKTIHDYYQFLIQKHKEQISNSIHDNSIINQMKSLEFQMIQILATSINDDNETQHLYPNPLRLEPGSIPMLVLYSLEDWKFIDEDGNCNDYYSNLNQNNANCIAKYHYSNDGLFPPTPTICLDNGDLNDTKSMESKIVDEIYNWIDEEDII